MKLIISHAALTQSGADMQAIGAAFGVTYDNVDPALMPAVDGKHYSVAHTKVGVGKGRDHIEITISDEAIARAAKIYVRIAQFAGPIVKQCIAFAALLQADINELGEYLLAE